MLKMYLVGKDELRNGLDLVKISKCRTENDFAILTYFYEVETLRVTSPFLFKEWKDFMQPRGLRDSTNLCVPPTEKEMQMFDDSLSRDVVLTDAKGNKYTVKERIKKDGQDGHIVFNRMKDFWNWYFTETGIKQLKK